MKIYVASSWRNDYQQGVVEALRIDGHHVYDFKGEGSGWGDGTAGAGGFGWKEVDPEWQNWINDIPRYLIGLNHPRALEGFKRDMDALMACDACVMVMPCGPSASMEMGWAVGAGKLVQVYIPAMREPDLMVKMADHVTTDLQAIRFNLLNHQRHARSAIQRHVVEWYERNGGCASIKDAINRMEKEIDELYQVAGINTHATKAIEEVADVGICLAIVAERIGVDLLSIMQWKMGINEVRKWNVAEDGTLHHIKSTDPRDKK